MCCRWMIQTFYIAKMLTEISLHVGQNKCDSNGQMFIDQGILGLLFIQSEVNFNIHFDLSGFFAIEIFPFLGINHERLLLSIFRKILATPSQDT